MAIRRKATGMKRSSVGSAASKASRGGSVVPRSASTNRTRGVTTRRTAGTDTGRSRARGSAPTTRTVKAAGRRIVPSRRRSTGRSTH